MKYSQKTFFIFTLALVALAFVAETQANQQCVTQCIKKRIDARLKKIPEGEKFVGQMDSRDYYARPDTPCGRKAVQQCGGAQRQGDTNAKWNCRVSVLAKCEGGCRAVALRQCGGGVTSTNFHCRTRVWRDCDKNKTPADEQVCKSQCCKKLSESFCQKEATENCKHHRTADAKNKCKAKHLKNCRGSNTCDYKVLKKECYELKTDYCVTQVKKCDIHRIDPAAKARCQKRIRDACAKLDSCTLIPFEAKCEGLSAAFCQKSARDNCKHHRFAPARKECETKNQAHCKKSTTCAYNMLRKDCYDNKKPVCDAVAKEYCDKKYKSSSVHRRKLCAKLASKECVKSDSCKYVPTPATVCEPRGGCDDSKPCTVDKCDEETGKCKHTPKVCKAASACHVALCNPTSGKCEQKTRKCEDEPTAAAQAACKAKCCPPLTRTFCTKEATENCKHHRTEDARVMCRDKHMKHCLSNDKCSYKRLEKECYELKSDYCVRQVKKCDIHKIDPAAKARCQKRIRDACAKLDSCTLIPFEAKCEGLSTAFCQKSAQKNCEHHKYAIARDECRQQNMENCKKSNTCVYKLLRKDCYDNKKPFCDAVAKAWCDKKYKSSSVHRRKLCTELASKDCVKGNSCEYVAPPNELTVCDPQGGCDDSNACTIDKCDLVSGKCVHTAKPCENKDLCHTAMCDPLVGVCKQTIKDCGMAKDVCHTISCDVADGECKNSLIRIPHCMTSFEQKDVVIDESSSAVSPFVAVGIVLGVAGAAGVAALVIGYLMQKSSGAAVVSDAPMTSAGQNPLYEQDMMETNNAMYKGNDV